MALDPTVGSATANTYATLAELNAYLVNRVPVPAAMTDPQKEASLIMAAQLLDASFNWTGAAVDAIQDLCWPRSGMTSRNGFAIATTVVPQALKEAQCELAIQLFASDRTADNDALKQGITSVKAGSVAVSFKDPESASTPEGMQAQINRLGPDFAYLAQAIPDAVRVKLVPSWYLTGSVLGQFVFETF